MDESERLSSEKVTVHFMQMLIKKGSESIEACNERVHRRSTVTLAADG